MVTIGEILSRHDRMEDQNPLLRAAVHAIPEFLRGQDLELIGSGSFSPVCERCA